MQNPAIAEALAGARATYPGVAIPNHVFYAHLAEKAAGAAALGATPDTLRIADLFLACGAAHRDPAAIAHLERETFMEVEAVHRRFSNLGLTLDEVKQRVRELLVFRDPPAIGGYAGTGSLRGWVRAAVLHMLLNVAQRETREEPTDDALFDVMLGSDASAEAEYVKLACRAELEAALASAMSTLSHRDRHLLRHAFVDGRNVDEIGAVYGVHRATAARWVSAARVQLVDLTRADLVRRLAISDAEAHSIIAAALSGVGSMLLARLTA